MSISIWRVIPAEPPAWPEACTRCAHPELISTDRFRVNSNGSRHDVWLIYRCPRCDARRKRSVLRRVRERPGRSLDPFRNDLPEYTYLYALAFGRGQRVPYLVLRPPLDPSESLLLEIEQPYAVGVRWDALLARELGCSRGEILNAWRSGMVLAESEFAARSKVRNGQRLSVRLSELSGVSSGSEEVVLANI